MNGGIDRQISIWIRWTNIMMGMRREASIMVQLVLYIMGQQPRALGLVSLIPIKVRRRAAWMRGLLPLPRYEGDGGSEPSKHRTAMIVRCKLMITTLSDARVSLKMWR